MKLFSNDFIHNAMLDKKFSFRKGNVSPHLKWTDIPKNTKSFAISCNDPDAPAGNWIHWMAFNIPATITEISQGGSVPGIELENDSRHVGYSGPAPPSGTHRYFFRVYALNVPRLEGITKKNFMKKINEHAIESAEIMGRYKV
jgi:Raf kinase inhibitor-like YbhB/YbcL family protein